MVILQNYTMSVQKSILMDTRLFQMLKKELGDKYNLINLFLETYNYDVWFKNEEWTDTTQRKSDTKESVDLSDMHPLEGDEVKEGTRLKILTPNKLLTRLPILLAQIKAGNNSCN